MENNPIVTITMEDGGKIVAELYPQVAPQSVYNFISLIKKGFYDGLIFHRCIYGFMIQGGCPDGTGMGGATLTRRTSATSTTPSPACGLSGSDGHSLSCDGNSISVVSSFLIARFKVARRHRPLILPPHPRRNRYAPVYLLSKSQRFSENGVAVCRPPATNSARLFVLQSYIFSRVPENLPARRQNTVFYRP